MSSKKKPLAKTLIPWSYVLAAAAAVLFTWLIHEWAHWFLGDLLGNEMAMTLNSSQPIDGHYYGRWHATIISAAGQWLPGGSVYCVPFGFGIGTPFLVGAGYCEKKALLPQIRGRHGTADHAL